MRHVWWVLLVVACEQEARPREFGGVPPDLPAHNRVEDGVRHARGNETPYLCSTQNGRGTCPTDVRPAQADLSCDASGCHGGTRYEPAEVPAERHLLGSEGPSCWACHPNREWSNRTTGNG